MPAPWTSDEPNVERALDRTHCPLMWLHTDPPAPARLLQLHGTDRTLSTDV